MPKDTSKADPAGHLLGMMGGGSEYVERMEADGQAELVAGELLPTEILNAVEADLEALGFTFGDPCEDDPLFRAVTLPAGWSMQPTDHAMWSAVVDERGIERVKVFYKAAFYDRRAHMMVADPGREMATRLIYSYTADLAAVTLLTETERGALVESLQAYVRTAAEWPDIYGDRLPKVEAALKAAQALERRADT